MIFVLLSFTCHRKLYSLIDKHKCRSFISCNGFNEFTMSATLILKARRQIASVDRKETAKLVTKALESNTEDDVKN